jgi:type I restriction enzyme M protein
MEPPQLNWIANFIWGIADDVLRDLYCEENIAT